MTAAQAVLFLATLFALPDATGSKAAILAIAQAAGLPANVWILGRPSERWIEIMGRALAAWGVVPTQAVRAMFFQLATDPGDVDDFGVPDQSADQTPRPGFLSAYGFGFFGVQRGGATFAESRVTVKNNGTTVSAPFKAGDLFFEASTLTIPGSSGGSPTYVSVTDPLYSGPGGTATIPAGGSLTLPVIAQQLGSQGAAAVNLIDTCVTQSFGPFAVTASTAANASDREARPDYIARCQRAMDRNSPGGPNAAYLYAMNTAADGTILQRYDGSGPVAITYGAIVSNANGVVDLYVGGPSGEVISVDVSSATLNISGLVQGVIMQPLGVLPDTVTLGPTVSDPNIIPSGTSGCANVTNTIVAVTYTVKILASAVTGGATAGTYTSGGSPPAPVAAIFGAVKDALTAYLISTGIGGQDQTAGAGVVYTDMLGPAIVGAFKGLYNPVVTTPAGSTTAIAVGHIAVAGTITGTIVAV